MTKNNPLKREQLVKLATEIHAANVAVGWWDDWPDKRSRYKTAMMLTVSEVAEAMEGHRKNLQDDHLPQFPMLAVELADTAIRLLDLAGAFECKFLYAASDVSEDVTDGSEIPEQLFNLVRIIAQRTASVVCIERSLGAVIAIANANNIDLWGIVEAKREYNAHRLDHKREARSKPGGKAF